MPYNKDQNSKSKLPTITKDGLHPRSDHRKQYDFEALVRSCPELKDQLISTPYGKISINFFNPTSVKMLNKALLMHFYQIEYWDIPKQYLCPPVPGRAEYIHRVADLFLNKHKAVPQNLNVLDLGVGANCIYPIIGITKYKWNFVGVDIDLVALESAQRIYNGNKCLLDRLSLRRQTNAIQIFEGVLLEDDFFDLCVCNPPFHASAADAQAASSRKNSNLKKKKITNQALNFGGQHHELWRAGGEMQFLMDMISESRDFSKSIKWFSCLVSKESNLNKAVQMLKNEKVKKQTILPMKLGNKKSRILAWTYSD